MKITFDPVKRERTLLERQLDFRDAAAVFEAQVYEFEDDRRDYGEKRLISVGYLSGRMVIVGHVQRGEECHVFSMRKANEREVKKYKERLDGG